MSRLVSVVGGTTADKAELETAYTLGALLAGSGFVVICGGGAGIMQSVCRGARSAGGTTVGILPGEDPAQANKHVDIALPTGMGSGRNRIVALSGSVMVAIGGRYGTLSEIAFALDAGRPVCSIGGWSGIQGVVQVGSPEDALRFVNRMTGRKHAENR